MQFKLTKGHCTSLLIAEEFIDKNPVCLILGDNLFHGDKLGEKLIKSSLNNNDAVIFGYKVSDPQRYGVISFDNEKSYRY